MISEIVQCQCGYAVWVRYIQTREGTIPVFLDKLTNEERNDCPWCGEILHIEEMTIGIGGR